MSDSLTEEPVAEEKAKEEKPKRTYRRRTAKAAANTAAVEVPGTDEVEEPKKKRTTRSRKVATAKDDTATDVANASESVLQENEVGVNAGEDSALDGDEGTKKPARRTRAKKEKVPDTKGPDAKEEVADIPSANDRAETESQTATSQSQEEKAESEKQEERRQPRGTSRKQRINSKNNAHQKGSHFRSRRTHQQNRREPVVPQTSKDDLAKLKVAELRVRAEELGVEHKGLKKAELVEAVFAASIKAEGFVEVSGILDVLSDGYGFLRTHGYLPSEEDVYVGTATIRRNGLRKGDYIKGQTRPARPNEKYSALHRIDFVNGIPFDQLGKRVKFSDLTPVFPDERLVLEHGKSSITARVIDLCAPIGKGQRGLIVSPPKAGKTTILKDIAASISANNPEVHLMCLLVDERPEEVTDMERSIRGEVISSTFDMPSENHIAVSELVIERAKRLVENGEDVVILLDSLTRLARAYNLAQPASGRILSGGVDSTALYPPKKFLGAARNIEGGGSLTILASALIETGSKMDEVIFEEFKGTGNMEVKLDRQLADRRIFPAIDPVASGTRREDLLLDPQEAPLIWAVRRVLANRNNTERAMDSLVKSLQQTNNNQEFLLRAAKKAQGHHFEEGNIEF